MPKRPTDAVVVAPAVPADSRRAVFFDVENSSHASRIARMLEHLGLPDGATTRVSAVGNWRVVSLEAAALLARAGAELVHSAPAAGVKDWSDLRIAVDAGRWLGAARAGDVLAIVSDDQAFDAVGDVAATRGVIFQRLSLRAFAERSASPAGDRRRGGRSQRSRGRRPRPRA